MVCSNKRPLNWNIIIVVQKLETVKCVSPTLGVKIANDGKSETDNNSGIAQVKQVYFMRKKYLYGKQSQETGKLFIIIYIKLNIILYIILRCRTWTMLEANKREEN